MKRIVIISAAAGCLLLAGTATAAVASIPDSSGVIHGCYNAAGQLRVVQGSCRPGETALSWSQQGPAGPPGPSLRTVVAEGTSSIAGPGGFETASLTCSGPYPLLISGGYEIDNTQTSPTDYAIVFSMPLNASTWAVRIAVPADAPGNVSWHLRAVCAAR